MRLLVVAQQAPRPHVQRELAEAIRHRASHRIHIALPQLSQDPRTAHSLFSATSAAALRFGCGGGLYMFTVIRHRSAAVLISLSIAGTAAAGDTCSPVMEWNKNALLATTLTTPAQGALVQIRSMAIVHASMHDAVNSITGEYETYLPAAPAPAGASAQAAAIAAANYALTKLFPTQGWDLTLEPSLTACGLSVTDPGVSVGRAAAAAVLASRPPDEVKNAA